MKWGLFIHLVDYTFSSLQISNYLFILSFTLTLVSCTLLQKKDTSISDCKKDSIKKLKRIKKTFTPAADGVYTYLNDEVEVPDGFETIYWERKIGRDYAVSIRLSDTLSMQYLLLPISLQSIIYGECDDPLSSEELIASFGPPTYIDKSLLPNAKETYVYSFNKPDQEKCFHGEFMGNVAYQDCLSIRLDINNKGQVVELNTSLFEIQP